MPNGYSQVGTNKWQKIHNAGEKTVVNIVSSFNGGYQLNVMRVNAGGIIMGQKTVNNYDTISSARNGATSWMGHNNGYNPPKDKSGDSIWAP